MEDTPAQQSTVCEATKAYWIRQAQKHERMAATLRAKYACTGESRWLKQAITNEQSAKGIRYNYDK